MTFGALFHVAGFAGVVLLRKLGSHLRNKANKNAPRVKIPSVKIPCVKCDTEIQTDRSWLQDHWELLRPRYGFKSESSIAADAARKMAANAIESVIAADAAHKMAATAFESVIAADAARKMAVTAIESVTNNKVIVVVEEVCDELTVSELVRTLKGPQRDAVERILNASRYVFGLLQSCFDLYMRTSDFAIREYLLESMDYYEHVYVACIMMIDRVLAGHPLCTLNSMTSFVKLCYKNEDFMPLISEHAYILLRNLQDMRMCLDCMLELNLSFSDPVCIFNLLRMQRDFSYLVDEVDALVGSVTPPIDAPLPLRLTKSKTRRGCRGNRNSNRNGNKKNKSSTGMPAIYAFGTAASCYWVNKGRRFV